MEPTSDAGMMTTMAMISWPVEQPVRTVVLRLVTGTNTLAGNAGNGKCVIAVYGHTIVKGFSRRKKTYKIGD